MHDALRQLPRALWLEILRKGLLAMRPWDMPDPQLASLALAVTSANLLSDVDSGVPDLTTEEGLVWLRDLAAGLAAGDERLDEPDDVTALAGG